MREQLDTGRPFYFVQVGANDGILDDPIREMVLGHRLRGLLVEPLPDMFQGLKENYADQPQLVFENVGILPQPGTLQLFRVRDEVVASEHWRGIASSNRRNLLAQGVGAADIESVVVEGVSMSQLFSRHGIAEVSLLQVDTEGFDHEVIRSTFDALVFPELINYEHCWLAPKARAACKRLLEAKGYDFIEIGKDTLARRRALERDQPQRATSS